MEMEQITFRATWRHGDVVSSHQHQQPQWPAASSPSPSRLLRVLLGLLITL